MEKDTFTLVWVAVNKRGRDHLEGHIPFLIFFKKIRSLFMRMRGALSSLNKLDYKMFVSFSVFLATRKCITVFAGEKKR